MNERRIEKTEVDLKTSIEAVVAEFGADVALEMLQRIADGITVEPEPSEVTKQDILDYISDLVSNFLYYDRKEDEDLPLGAIEDAVENDVITIDEMVDAFARSLRDGLSEALEC